ncbi:MAG: NAD-dependent epimerase/dehydratase family protein [Williamsia sp.]|nr:NAD-dependent epimerase/dehydratase family protein [Williamsia sp.]
MRRKLLITGASGFVGYHLIREALRQGDAVFAAVRKTSQVSHLQQPGINLVYPNFQQTELLKGELEGWGITHIVHAAALTKAASQQEYNYANAVLARNLAQAASSAAIDLQRFVFLSSLAAMGPSLNGLPITEDQTPHPVTFYGKSKLLAEQYLADVGPLPLTGLRPTAVYGPREKDLFIVLNMIRRGAEFYIGKEPQRLSFVYVSDLVDGVFKAFDSPATGSYYHVSDGQTYDRYALASFVKELLKIRTLRLHVPLKLVSFFLKIQEGLPRRKGKVSILNRDKLQELTANWDCSIEKARRELKYQPAVLLKEGLSRTIEWYQANNWF